MLQLVRELVQILHDQAPIMGFNLSGKPYLLVYSVTPIRDNNLKI